MQNFFGLGLWLTLDSGQWTQLHGININIMVCCDTVQLYTNISLFISQYKIRPSVSIK